MKLCTKSISKINSNVSKLAFHQTENLEILVKMCDQQNCEKLKMLSSSQSIQVVTKGKGDKVDFGLSVTCTSNATNEIDKKVCGPCHESDYSSRSVSAAMIQNESLQSHIQSNASKIGSIPVGPMQGTPSRTAMNVHPTLRQEQDSLFVGFPGTVSTPSISIQFSPFMIFSNDRSQNTPNSPTAAGLLELANQPEKSTNDNDTLRLLLSFANNGTSQTSDRSLNIPIQGTKSPLNVVPPASGSLIATSETSANKRKASNISRQPQKRYSVTNADTPGSDLFGAKLTTNMPREVQVVSPMTGESFVYSSCSEAARAMSVNRTKLSRTCRAGGGRIGNHVYKVSERINHSLAFAF